MLDKLAGIEKHYEDINEQLADTANNYQRVAELSKERSDLEPLVEKSRRYRQGLKRIQEAEALLATGDSELGELAQMELDELLPLTEALERELKLILVPKDPRDDRNVIVEVRAGTGGEEAALFAADLYRMYSRYAERRNWKTEIISQNETGLGGLKEIILLIKGRGAYSRLKFESGVHRVQRVPTTEAQGRIHTSTITVAMMAEVDDVEIDIPESDIRTEVFRSSGAGGQNVQKNSTAVRITHLPTGMVVACQDERSQLQNRMRAMSILKARLYEIELQRRQQEREEARRSQVGTGERSEKIRTYNYPQSRITDHRINLSSYNLPSILDGGLDFFIDELSMQNEADRLASSGPEDDDA